jgi:hypothetical protein
MTLRKAIERWLERTPFVKLDNFDFLQEYRKAVENMYDEDAKLLEKNFDPTSSHYATELAKNRE